MLERLANMDDYARCVRVNLDRNAIGYLVRAWHLGGFTSHSDLRVKVYVKQ